MAQLGSQEGTREQTSLLCTLWHEGQHTLGNQRTATCDRQSVACRGAPLSSPVTLDAHQLYLTCGAEAITGPDHLLLRTRNHHGHKPCWVLLHWLQRLLRGLRLGLTRMTVGRLVRWSHSCCDICDRPLTK